MKSNFFNSIQVSLLLLLLTLFGIASVGLVIVFGIESTRLERLAAEEKNQMIRTFDKILLINTKELADLIFYEYAQWDETVNFIKKPNDDFTKVNIDWLIEDNKFDGIWLMNLDTENLYANTNKNIEEFPFDKKELPEIFAERNELFFYTGTNEKVIEIYASTINLSSDFYKEGEPFGYFVAARTWSDRLLTSFEDLTNSSIKMCRHENHVDDDSRISEGIINFSKQFSDYNNIPFARIDISVKSKFLEGFWDSSMILFGIIGILGFILLVIFGIVTNIVITKPLKKIILALDDGQTSNITYLKSTPNEFGKIAGLIDKFFTQKEELRILIAQKSSAEEEERKRISRELHDSVGQILMSTKLKLNFAIKDLNTDCEGLEEIKDDINRVGTELNNIIHALHPVDLERYGLVKSVENLCENFSKLLRFQIQFKTYDLVDRIEYEIELALYRVVQESLKNIMQHAKCSAVAVEIYRRTNSVYLAITDNGVGFDKEKTRLRLFSKIGNGLINIQYRAEALGGKFNIESSHGNGTEIHIEIPIDA